MDISSSDKKELFSLFNCFYLIIIDIKFKNIFGVFILEHERVSHNQYFKTVTRKTVII